MRRRAAQPGGEVKMDLTPLIDCVFLMILFFVLTTEITVQVEDVNLPIALEGKTVETAADVAPPLIINVGRTTRDGDDRVGRIVMAGQELTKETLVEELTKEAAYDAAPRPGGRGRGWETGPANNRLSKLEVVVRADRGVNASHVRQVLDACSAASIYKLKVSSVTSD